MALNTDSILSDIKESYSDYEEINDIDLNYKYVAVKKLIEDTDYDFKDVTINYVFHGVIEMMNPSMCECFAIAEPKSVNEAATYIDASDKPCDSIAESIKSFGWR